MYVSFIVTTYKLDIYDSSSSTLYPVPVQIQMDDSTSITSASSGPLYRRFFMYDNTGGIQKGGTVPNVVRFVQSAELRVTLNPSGSSQIYPPLLSIKYSGRLTSSSQQSSDPNADSANTFPTGSSSTLSTPYITFTATYYKDMSTSWIVMLVFACVFAGLAIVAAFFRVYIFQKHRRNVIIDLKVLLRLLVYSWAIWSDYAFIVIYGVAAYCYLFFKYPTSVFALLPNSTLDLTFFGLMMGFTLLGKIIDIMFTVFMHCSHDIFFIDFEKSRGKLFSNRGRAGGNARISIWRTILVAKNWKKLQAYRVINMSHTLLFLLFLLYGCNAIYLATEQPSPTYLSSQDRTNAVLRFAIVSTLWISIALAQYLYYRLFHFRFVRNPLWLFVDLCSLSNISVLLLVEECFGYYIHGESPHPHADADFKEFHEYLTNERENKVRNRGLVDETTANNGEPIQTFEIHIQQTTRQSINEKLSIPIAEDKLQKNLRGGNQGNQSISSPGVQSPTANQELLNSQQPQQRNVLSDLSTLRFHDILSGSLAKSKRKLQSGHLYDAYYNLNMWLQQYIRNVSRISRKRTHVNS
jgi:meckelin